MVNQVLQSIPRKVSLLTIGDEILEGDIQDTNSNHFAKVISERGGVIHQCVQVVDDIAEIVDAMRYLSKGSSAIILTGGLGPTSDDKTRFAISEYTGKPLYEDDRAWQHIVALVTSRHRTVHDSNKQQTLFPEGAELYHNEMGTAYGCYIAANDQHLFMLPGPPRENLPMFEGRVLPTLAEHDYFNHRKIYRLLATGFTESEIAARVDELAKAYPCQTGYRFMSPNVEIKIKTASDEDVDDLIKQIEALIESRKK